MTRAKVVYLDTCLPDYFQGYAGHVYAVYPYGSKGAVRQRLLQAIGEEELFYPSDTGEFGESVAEHVYDGLKSSVAELFTGQDLRKRFAHLERSRHPGGEHPLAFFGVKWE